jgi:hypothetical protein
MLSYYVSVSPCLLFPVTIWKLYFALSSTAIITVLQQTYEDERASLGLEIN